jgi:hypothetical protein
MYSNETERQPHRKELAERGTRHYHALLKFLVGVLSAAFASQQVK